MTASHGGWCGAVTWPTNARNCQEHFFFFGCNCGSVFHGREVLACKEVRRSQTTESR